MAFLGFAMAKSELNLVGVVCQCQLIKQLDMYVYAHDLAKNLSMMCRNRRNITHLTSKTGIYGTRLEAMIRELYPGQESK